MKAMKLRSFGSSESLQLEECAKPQPLPTEILVRVEAVGVNPVDWITCEGKGMTMSTGEPPFIPGWDVAGIVEAVAPGVTRFKPGDKVYGLVNFPRIGAAYAEYVCGPARHFALRPAHLHATEAATLPLPGLTAWQALINTARIQPRQHVVIHAAGGAVGSIAVQIAKAHGARVTAVASARHHRWLKVQGVDDIVDYTKVPFEKHIKNADVVLDLAGKDTAFRSIPIVAKEGTILGLAPPSVDFITPARLKGRRADIMLVEPDYASLEKLTQLVDQGGIQPLKPYTFPLDQAAEAHAMYRAGKISKVVLIP